MQIKIGWQNINTEADGIRVYRSPTTIVAGALPSVYDLISGNATGYTDTNVLAGATYYYVFEVFKGTDSIFSSNIPATAAVYSGPGPQQLLAGDLDAGYYGIVAASDFITWDTFVTWSGITISNVNPYPSQEWLKFAFKGKTLFTPKQPIGTTLWSTLYSAGLVYGLDSIGPREYNTLAGVNQLRTITVANSQFKVRLPTALPPGFDLTKDFVNANSAVVIAGTNGNASNDSYDTNFDLSGSEWNDLFYKIFSWTPASQRGENWIALDTLVAYNGLTSYNGLGGDGLFQEFITGNRFVSRGTKNTYSYHPGKTSTLAHNAPYYWRPILEMI